MISGDPRWIAVTLAAWLLTYSCHSTMLLGVVALLGRFRRLPASLEQTLWKTALLGSIMTATIVILGLDNGAFGLRIHLAPASPVPALVSNSLLRGDPAVANDAELPARWTGFVLASWVLLAGWGLLRLKAAGNRLRRDLGERRPLAAGPHREALAELQESAGLYRNVRLTVSDRIGSPIAMGQDEICLPARALTDLPPEEIRSALAHELAHLVNRDPGWKSFTAGLCALFFFQPLLRLARRRIDETAEYLADDWAVRHSGSEMSLARCLARVAGWQAPRRIEVAASGMAGSGSPLLKRVERLLGARPSEPAPVWCYAGALVLVICGWILSPAATLRPREVSSGLLAQVPPIEHITPLPSFPPSSPMVVMPSAPRPRAMLHPDREGRHESRPERHRYRLLRERRPLLDRETTPRSRVIVIPHEVLRARLLRALSDTETLNPEVARALIEAQRRLLEMEMAQRGVKILWMVEPTPPAPTPPVPETPAPPRTFHETQI